MTEHDDRMRQLSEDIAKNRGISTEQASEILKRQVESHIAAASRFRRALELAGRILGHRREHSR